MGTTHADILRKRPLRLILLVGLALRILAAFNSPGYLMHDDHFLVVETGASWAVGEDYNNWMPWSQRANGIENPTPHQANLAYAGIMSGYFRVCNAVGFVDPAGQMLLLRLLHGLFSLLIVALGFRIAEKLGGERPARWTGWALAAFGLFPLLGVRQLVEVVCIPPLLWAAWVVVRTERRTWKTWALAGIGIGIATALRYQCGVFGLGWIIALLVHERKWQQAVLNSAIMGCAALLTFALGQLQDVFIWGEPFAQLRAYIEYNSTHAGAYPQGFWHQYFWVVLGLLVPPFSLAWVFGTAREVKRLALLVIPPLAFFLFHSAFPNKQERFILPAVPFIVAAGSIGWHAFVEGSGFWQRRAQLHRGLVAVGLLLSVGAGIGLCFIQPKKSRVDAMTALYDRGDLENFLIVHAEGGAMPPQFYSGSWKKYWTSDLSTDVANHRQVMCNSPRYTFPNYIVFSGDRLLGEAVQRYKPIYPSMEYVQHVPPSRWDRLLADLNPHNRVERMLIYRIDPAVECGTR